MAWNWYHEETNTNNPQLRKLDVFPSLFFFNLEIAMKCFLTKFPPLKLSRFGITLSLLRWGGGTKFSLG